MAEAMRPEGKPWRLQLICCGREDGVLDFATRGEAEVTRSSYTSRPLGEHDHDRAAILTGPDQGETDPGKILADYLDALSKDALSRSICGDMQTLLTQLRAETAEAEVTRPAHRGAIQTEAVRAATGLADCWKLRAELAEAQLARIGDEWQIRYKIHGASWTEWTEPVRREDVARRWLADFLRNNPGSEATLLHRRMGEWRDAEPADAPAAALSATLPAAEGAEGSADARTPVRAAAELSEVRDQSAWCWAPNPKGPLPCGRLARHDGPHKRGERTWDNDARQDAATEAEQ